MNKRILLTVVCLSLSLYTFSSQLPEQSPLQPQCATIFEKIENKLRSLNPFILKKENEKLRELNKNLFGQNQELTRLCNQQKNELRLKTLNPKNEFNDLAFAFSLIICTGVVGFLTRKLSS